MTRSPPRWNPATVSVAMALTLLLLLSAGGLPKLAPVLGNGGPTTAVVPRTLGGWTPTPVRSASPAPATPLTVPVNGSYPAWANLTGTVGAAPPGRSFSTATIYDPIDHYSLVFGGYTNRHAYLNDTWSYTTGHWTNLSPAHSPPPRDHASLAFDARDGYVLLFGGTGPGLYYNDTWSFVGGVWTNITPAISPGARWAAAMAYDPRDRDVVLYGGCLTVELSDTWTFTGGLWTQLHPSPSPAGRGGADFGYDPADGFMTLFGGDNASLIYNDTWWYANGTWEQVLTTVSPPARHGGTFAFDATLEQMVLFGGGTSNGVVNDTWWFTHRTWRNETYGPSPSIREYAMMSNDSSDGYLVLFGGEGPGNLLLTDTWVYDAIVTNAAAVPGGGLAPLNVSFTEATTNGFGPYAESWSFGDGVSATGVVTTHQYHYGGAYRPSVAVTDRYGAASIAVLTVDVAGPLDGTFTAQGVALPAAGVVPLNVTFAGLAASGDPPYRYLWSFGDGNNSSTNEVAHTYTRTGTFLARFTAWDAFGSTSIQNVTVVVADDLALGFDVTQGQGSTATYYTVTVNASVAGGFPPYQLNVSWDDGSYSSAYNVSHHYTKYGAYAITLTATDSHQDRVVRAIPVSATLGSGGGGNPLNGLLGGPSGIAIAALAGAVVGGLIIRAMLGRKPDGGGATTTAPEPEIEGEPLGNGVVGGRKV
ncbi:MAG: PKD domain-containing protein [Thermoplasmata archaeon]|nr:PKD domain-containing protein [Thermoplasmata archaeon]